MPEFVQNKAEFKPKRRIKILAMHRLRRIHRAAMTPTAGSAARPWASHGATALVCLVLALLFAQSMGQLHRIKHRGFPAALQSQPVTLAAAGAPTASAPVHFWFSRFFLTHDEGSPDCRLFDQSQPEGVSPSVAALVFPTLPLSMAVALFSGAALARWAALFDARGPPPTA